jgi:hypothetical protein
MSGSGPNTTGTVLVAAPDYVLQEIGETISPDFEVLVAPGASAITSIVGARQLVGAIVHWDLEVDEPLDVCERIRGLPHHQHLPVLFFVEEGGRLGEAGEPFSRSFVFPDPKNPLLDILNDLIVQNDKRRFESLKKRVQERFLERPRADELIPVLGQHAPPQAPPKPQREGTKSGDLRSSPKTAKQKREEMFSGPQKTAHDWGWLRWVPLPLFILLALLAVIYLLSLIPDFEDPTPLETLQRPDARSVLETR